MVRSQNASHYGGQSISVVVQEEKVDGIRTRLAVDEVFRIQIRALGVTKFYLGRRMRAALAQCLIHHMYLWGRWVVSDEQCSMCRKKFNRKPVQRGEFSPGEYLGWVARSSCIVDIINHVSMRKEFTHWLLTLP